MKIKMKKIFTLGAMLAAAFSLTNCTEEVYTPVEKDVPYTILANAVETKTVNDGFSTKWAERDAVSVFHAAAGTTEYSQNSKFTVTDLESGLFKTSSLYGELAASNDWFAFYPYHASMTAPAGTDTGAMTVASEADGVQTQNGNDDMAHIAGRNYPMWGVARNVSDETLPALGMTHMTSLVEVEVTNATDADAVVSTVSLTGTESLVGAYYIDFTGETPVFTALDEKSVSNTANLEVTAGEAIAAGAAAKFYLAVKPFTAPAGSSLSLFVNGFEERIELEKAVTFAPGKVKTLKYSIAPVSAGGSLNVTAGEPETAVNDIAVELTAAGAERILYSYLTAAELRKYTSDEKKAAYLLESGKKFLGETVVAKASEVVKEIKANTKYTLIALAIGPDGKYGEVLTLESKTKEVVYNDLEVSLAIELNDPGNVVISVSAPDAVDYLYWLGKTTDNTWNSNTYLGASASKAEKYMSMHFNDAMFTDLMEKYPVVDGKITMTDLEVGKDYIMVAMAKDAEGLYSHAKELRFNPNAYAIGKIVPKSDPRWEAAHPVIEWIPEKFEPGTQLSGKYGYYITLPAGYTSYVMSGTDTYFTEEISNGSISTERKILEIMSWADRLRDVDFMVDYDEYRKKDYPYGHEFFRYLHGAPNFGYAVVWPSKEYHEQVCGCVDAEYIERTYQYNPAGPVNYKRYHVVVVNEGKPIEFYMDQAIGSKTEVVDRVFVVVQDAEGNCYEPFEWDVPTEYFNK